MTDLDKLIDAVEGGSVEPDTPHAGLRWDDAVHLLMAYHGSLDAAKALHEALLTGWYPIYDGAKDCVCVIDDVGKSYTHSATSNPARAWLIAVLKAYRSVQ